MPSNVWTLDDGVKLVRALQGRCKEFGFHVALAGSVLNNGESQKDIDLIFLPFNNPKFPEAPGKLITWLNEMWDEGEPIGADYEEEPPADPEPIPFPVERGARARGMAVAPPPVYNVFRAGQDGPERLRVMDPMRIPPEWIGGGAWIDEAEPARVEWRENPLLPAEPPALPVFNVDFNYENILRGLDAPQAKTKTKKSCYRWKLKFIRPGNDRIDVFIV